MSSSLRARLWLSYALLVLSALTVTALFIIVYLIRNPFVYRQTFTHLQDIEAILQTNQPGLGSLPIDSLLPILKQYDQTYDVRLLILDKNRQLQADSRAGSSPALSQPRLLRILILNRVIKDDSGAYWLFIAEKLSDERWLLLAVPRQKVHLLTIIRDDLFLPFIEASALALILSLVIAFGVARWIADPLQQVVAASRQMPARQAAALPLKGPREVQTLTRTFNEMTARVQASQKSQRDFVANVSHELKTPLTSIQGFAQAILDGTADTPEARQQAARVIHDEAGRMHRLVLDLLDLARLDAGIADFQRAPVDIPTLLDSVVEKFTPQARKTGISFQVQAPALPPLIGDGDRLAQVLTNLVDNAMKFTPGGSQIILSTLQVGNEIEVSVTDSGIGIPSAEIAHIFDRFHQADPARKGGEKHGAGLGLAIVKEIVQAHGGTISVRSAPGEGSTFTVMLPLTPPADKSVAKRQK
jgi:signal transduction histidine kinase